MQVLAVNAGSSSLKLRLLGDDDELLASTELAASAGRADPVQLREALDGMRGADAIAHRVVHGGTRFTGPVRLDAEITEALRDLTPLAPLHQPAALDAMAAVSAVLPDRPAVACLDTAFHSHLPDAAATYALPREWRERHSLRRFGFHGLSHAYASRRAAELLGRRPEQLRVVSCHLGAGASLAAVDGGRSVDTTMGFTPVEGLVMATRSGSVDPGLLLWLLQHGGLGVDEVSDALEHRSGLLALAGTADMREVLAAARAGDPQATWRGTSICIVSAARRRDGGIARRRRRAGLHGRRRRALQRDPDGGGARALASWASRSILRSTLRRDPTPTSRRRSPRSARW